MRLAAVLLIVIVVAFAATALVGGRRSADAPGDGAPQKSADGSYDADDLSDWKQRPYVSSPGNLLASFGPKLKLDDPHIALGPNQTATREVPPPPPTSRLLALVSMSQTRVARVEITGGAGGLLVSYACVPKEGRECKPVCICSPGSTFAAIQIAACPRSWRDKRLRGEACTGDDAHTSLVIYPEPATLSFTTLGLSGIEAEVR